MQLQWKDDFVVFFTMTRDCHPPSPSAWSNTYLWVVELTWEIPRRIADGFWDAMQIVAVPMEDICIMVGLVVSVMLSWWLLCRELQDKMVVLNQQCWIRWLKMPGKQTVGAGGLQEEWCAWFPWETPLSFLGGKLLVLQVIFMALTERLVPLSSPHCIRQDRAPVMEGEGWGGCPLCLGLTWQDVKDWKDCPGISIAASRTPLQGVGGLRWCFVLSICGELLSPGHAVGVFAPLLAESLVYLILNLVFVHPK